MRTLYDWTGTIKMSNKANRHSYYIEYRNTTIASS